MFHLLPRPMNAELRRYLIRAIAAVCAAVLVMPEVRADAYPDKPIKMIVPFPPGGATDNVSRLIAKSMGDNLGQTVFIENRGGAGATIGADAVARSAPDGYTILSSTAGVHVVNPAIYKKLSYDPVKSFEPVGQIISAPLVMVVSSESPFKTAKELIDYAKKNPGKLTFGSAGSGSSLHQNGEMFKDAAGIDLVHVPYRGAGPALNDFLGGQVDVMFSYVGSMLPLAQKGRVRMLAIGSPKRLALIGDVPTVAEVTGRTGYDADTWTGLVVPAGTPAPIVKRLHQALTYALEKNKESLIASGYVIVGGTPEAMGKRISTELRTVTPLLSRLMEPVDTK